MRRVSKRRRAFDTPQMEREKKDPGSGWSRVLVTNLCSWEWSQFLRMLLPLLFVTCKGDLVSLRATLERASFALEQRSLSFTISTITPSTTEAGSNNC